MSERTSDRYVFIDAFRGIAAVYIALFHLDIMLESFNRVQPLTLLYTFPGYAYGAIEPFFVISGFAMACTVTRQYVTLKYMVKFFAQRIVRIAPAYWIALGMLVSCLYLENFFKKNPIPLFGTTEVVYNMMFLQNLLNVKTILPVSWTLCIEMQLYIFFIVVYACIFHFNRQIKDGFSFTKWTQVLLVFLMIFSILQNTSLAFMPNNGLFVKYWYNFSLGCIIFWMKNRAIHPSLYWLIMFFIGCLEFSGRWTGPHVFIPSILVFVFYFRESWRRWLEGPVLQYLGKISYSLYLMHWVVGVKIIGIILVFFGKYFDNYYYNALLMLTMLGVSIIASNIFHRLVEYPFVRLSKYFKKPKMLIFR